MAKKVMVVSLSALMLTAMVLCGCLDGTTARVEEPIESACVSYADLPLDSTVTLSAAGSTGDPPDIATLPRCSEAMQVGNVGTSTSLRLLQGQAIHVTLQSDAPMYYPGVSDVWEDQAKLSVQVARIEGPATEGEQWGCVHGNRYDYGEHSHLLFHYTGDSDRHIEIVIACPVGESAYKLAFRNLDPDGRHSVQYSIAICQSPRQFQARLTEKHNVQLTVHMLMTENGLTTVPHPVTDPASATNDMTAFPDAISDWNAAGGKSTDPHDLSYRSGDRAGYLLYGHDLVADGTIDSTVNYMPKQTTLFYYTVDPDGTVHQYYRPGGAEYLD